MERRRRRDPNSERASRAEKPSNHETEVGFLGRAGPTKPPSEASQVRLAAVAVDLNVRLRSADMPAEMQERALRRTRALLDSAPDGHKLSPTHLAHSLKKEFDALYGPAWHCVVGKSFGSFVTHSSGGFVYFSIEKLSFLLFKTQVRPVKITAQVR